MSPKKSPLQSTAFGILLGFIGLCIFAFGLYQYPPINERLSWRIDYALINAKSVFNPVKPLPTSLPETVAHPTDVVMGADPDTATPRPTATTAVTLEATATPTPDVSPTPTLSPTPIPDKASLAAPAWEKEDLNNCGPATLTMYLRFWGWQGVQKDISDIIKPIRADRNVNVEELMYFVLKKSGGYYGQYRVGGSMDMLKKFIAAGIPVMVESGFKVDKTYWVNDDRWVGHYLLLTGYDDSLKFFTVQDSEKGANTIQTYDQLDHDWQVFNRVYIMVYPPEKQELVKELLGPEWDSDANRQHALDAAKAETVKNPQDGYGWFNLGTNYLYFERYTEAAAAYDTARKLQLPQRMLRYQFGPFMAYFHTNRIDDLMTLTDYALQVTPNSEEALLWKGWGLYRQGKKADAIASFQAALDAHPGYGDANYALTFVQNN